jgi:hypothetical protein
MPNLSFGGIMLFKKSVIILLVSLITISIVLAENVKVEGIANNEYRLIGGWGWKVDVDKVISGPPTLMSRTLSVGLASVSPTIPKGTIDPNISAGNRVEAYGELDEDHIKLYGSSEYYVKNIASENNLPEMPEMPASNGVKIDSPVGIEIHGWDDAPEINLNEVYTDNFVPFSGNMMFQNIYRRFYVPSSGKITAKVLKVPSNGVIMIWLQQLDDPSTFVSSPMIFDDQGNLVGQGLGQPMELKANVIKPAYWGIMIQCATKGGLQDSEYSFTVTQGCDWTGKWDISLGPSNGKEMDLQMLGNAVTGSYSNEGHITGTVSGNRLVGAWSEPPDYSEPRNKGDFEFIISDDCSSFIGSWRLGSSGAWAGQWTGKRADSGLQASSASATPTDRGPDIEDCEETLALCRENNLPDVNTSDPCGAYEFCLAAEACSQEAFECRCRQVNDNETDIEKCVQANAYDCGPRPTGC